MKSSHPRSTTARQKILRVTEMAGEHHTVIPSHKSAEHRDHEHSTGTWNKDLAEGRDATRSVQDTWGCEAEVMCKHRNSKRMKGL